MLVTKKYGIPSAKYSVGTHTNGEICLYSLLIIYARALLEISAIVCNLSLVLDHLDCLVRQISEA